VTGKLQGGQKEKKRQSVRRWTTVAVFPWKRKNYPVSN